MGIGDPQAARVGMGIIKNYSVCSSFHNPMYDEFSFELQQLLGYHSRVPASLDEWYQPENKRFYKKEQD